MLDRFIRWLRDLFRGWVETLTGQRLEAPVKRRRSGFYGPGKMPKNWLPYYGSRRWREKRSRQVMRMLRKNEVD